MTRLTADELRVLADAYRYGADIAASGRAQEMARAQAGRVQRAFRDMQQHIRVEFVDQDPYQSFEQLREDVLNRRMLVYTGGSETPLWTPEVNWMARAVHDYDHVVESADFSPEGEIAAYRAAARKVPALEPLYLSEIVLQAADSALRGFTPGVAQKLVETSPDVECILRSRRNGNVRAEDVRQAAAILHVVGLEGLMMHLIAAGYDGEDAVRVALAASWMGDAKPT